jgi:hypothetical protein
MWIEQDVVPTNVGEPARHGKTPKPFAVPTTEVTAQELPSGDRILRLQDGGGPKTTVIFSMPPVTAPDLSARGEPTF